jgi:hypothetical protein
MCPASRGLTKMAVGGGRPTLNWRSPPFDEETAMSGGAERRGEVTGATNMIARIRDVDEFVSRLL